MPPGKVAVTRGVGLRVRLLGGAAVTSIIELGSKLTTRRPRQQRWLDIDSLIPIVFRANADIKSVPGDVEALAGSSFVLKVEGPFVAVTTPRWQ